MDHQLPKGMVAGRLAQTEDIGSGRWPIPTEHQKKTDVENEVRLNEVMREMAWLTLSDTILAFLEGHPTLSAEGLERFGNKIGRIAHQKGRDEIS